MNPTKIAWADFVWNPVTGCTPAGQGCKNCYAKSLHDKRHKGWKDGWATAPPQYHVPFKQVQCHEHRLGDPLKRRKPATVFVCSMSDLFHEDVPDGFIGNVLTQILWATQHTFMVLTKRPRRMRACLERLFAIRLTPAPNLWLGVSVSTQGEADKWVPELVKCPAAKRFVSFEPALGNLNLEPWFDDLDWIIMGCESGKNRRRMDPWWAQGMRNHCQAAKTAFFLKQMEVNGRVVEKPELDGRQWLEIPSA